MSKISGMHWVMRFIEYIDVLMRNSGLLSWVKSAFGGAENMLTGKKLPTNVGALRFAMLELRRDYVGEKTFLTSWIFIKKYSVKALG